MKCTFLPLLVILFSASCISGQTVDKIIAAIDDSLSKGQTTISKILSDEKYMHLHALTPFRDVIKKYAQQEKVTMVTPTEPGKRVTVKVTITTGNKPLNDALVYLYHTSAKGWYSDTGAHIHLYEGDVRHARLFCYVKTDDKGKIEIETIQPAGYPNSDLPAHIHIAVSKNGVNVSGVPGELLFDDDPRLTPERKNRSLQEGFMIEKNTGGAGKPVYLYHIQLNE
jgi:protocatechuate 3,4-dioxygenase beta subunit